MTKEVKGIVFVIIIMISVSIVSLAFVATRESLKGSNHNNILELEGIIFTHDSQIVKYKKEIESLRMVIDNHEEDYLKAYKEGFKDGFKGGFKDGFHK